MQRIKFYLEVTLEDPSVNEFTDGFFYKGGLAKLRRDQEVW